MTAFYGSNAASQLTGGYNAQTVVTTSATLSWFNGSGIGGATVTTYALAPTIGGQIFILPSCVAGDIGKEIIITNLSTTESCSIQSASGDLLQEMLGNTLPVASGVNGGAFPSLSIRCSQAGPSPTTSYLIF
jgi:hypothetical protein